MVDEIENYLYSLDDYNLASETFGHYDGDECAIDSTIIMEFEPLFSDAENLLSMLRDIDTKIKSIVKTYA